MLLEGLAAGIGVFLEAFAVGLGAFVTGAEEVAGQTVGIGIEGDEAFEEALARGNLGDGLLRVRDAGKRGEGVLAVGAIGEVFLESGLGGDFGTEEFRIMQCGDGTVPGLAGVLIPKSSSLARRAFSASRLPQFERRTSRRFRSASW